VFSGASYQPVVAPNSWAVAFGTAMATETVAATLTASGQWPTTLGGITMTVDGQPTELFYVSPHQIDFLVPYVTDFGTVNVVITSTGTGATQTSTANLQNTAVGIFTSNSSGSGPGAILNGVTGAGPPFLVVTPQNGGSDLRTRLAIYCTGLRYVTSSTDVTALGTDNAGNRYNFTVEYAGASDPAYPGLDQVNIVLPAQLDGAGAISLTITADSTSNAVTFQMGSIPASELALTGLTLATSETTGGTSVTGTVSLNGVARTSGFPVALRSSDTTVSVPAVIGIPQGQASQTFMITTEATATTQSATITATAASGAETSTATLQIDPSNVPQLDSFTVTPASVQGGTSFSGTVQLSEAAPLGGVNVQIASSDTVVQAPANANVQVNSSSKTFTIPTTSVTTVHTVTLTAKLGSTSLSQQVTVVPPLQLTLSSSAVTGGTSVTGTITLGNAAPAQGIGVLVTSSGTAFASTPGTVTIGSGQTSTTFTITTYAVTAAHTVTITASAGTLGLASTTLTVNPPTTGQLQSLTISPTQAPAGSSATGTITLSGPAPFGGLIVTLRSSNALAATVPQTVTVGQGNTSATFTITIGVAASAQQVTITATAGSISETATLIVQ
jgi:uncharacterized protein (TIGR03437 family)